ncbi:MAG: glycosyltransferase family 4 protein [Pyrinomonadaceae bacterium]|nr:glycosyltransferase family 4 protein [Pyrinomonadaceae bacterium]
MPIADKILARRLEKCDIFIGWQQLGYDTVARAKELGAWTIVEHPSVAAGTWMALIDEEYERWKHLTRGTHAIFSARQIERMQNECRRADVVNVQSSFAQQSMFDLGLSREKVTVVPLGVDHQRFSPINRHFQANERMKVLYVGRLELLKGVQYLLEAFTQIKTPEIELHLVGPVLQEIQPILRTFADERIFVHGHLEGPKLASVYRESDIFVFPSINDGFGMVILEAMASGLPTIATVNTAAPDIISDGVDGFIVPIRDARALRDRIERLLDDTELRSSIGLRARETIIANYTIGEYERRLSKMLATILS